MRAPLCRPSFALILHLCFAWFWLFSRRTWSRVLLVFVYPRRPWFLDMVPSCVLWSGIMIPQLYVIESHHTYSIYLFELCLALIHWTYGQSSGWISIWPPPLSRSNRNPFGHPSVQVQWISTGYPLDIQVQSVQSQHCFLLVFTVRGERGDGQEPRAQEEQLCGLCTSCSYPDWPSEQEVTSKWWSWLCYRG